MAEQEATEKLHEHTGCRRFLKDPIFRKNLLLTISVFGSYLVLGFAVTQIGPALPDLQLLAGIDLETVSWLITAWSIAFMPGSLVSGFLYDRYNRLAIMFASTVGTAISCVCLPYAGSFPAMVIVRVATGLFNGGIDTGANTIVPSTWGPEAAPYMQALYLSYTIGGILSPFATKPFMVPRHSDDQILHGPNRSISNRSNLIHRPSNQSNMIMLNKNVSLHDGTHSFSLHNSSFEMYDINQSFYNNNNDVNEITSNIHPSFIITSVLVLLSSVPYIVMIILGGYDTKAGSKSDDRREAEMNGAEPTVCVANNNSTHQQLMKEDTHSNEDCEVGQSEQTEATDMVRDGEIKTAKRGSKLRSNGKILVLVAVSAMNFLYSATENSIGDFLVTFCRDYLQWDNGPAVTLTSLYWAASCVGGMLGIILVKILGSGRLLTIALLIWNVSFLGLLIASIYRLEILVWISLPLAGIVMVVIIPTVISWTAENVCRISGKISSVLMIASGSGLTLNPIFIGYMMEGYSYMYFIIIVLVESLLCSVFYLLVRLGKYYFTRNIVNST